MVSCPPPLYFPSWFFCYIVGLSWPPPLALAEPPPSRGVGGGAFQWGGGIPGGRCLLRVPERGPSDLLLSPHHNGAPRGPTMRMHGILTVCRTQKGREGRTFRDGQDCGNGDNSTCRAKQAKWRGNDKQKYTNFSGRLSPQPKANKAETRRQKINPQNRRTKGRKEAKWCIKWYFKHLVNKSIGNHRVWRLVFPRASDIMRPKQNSRPPLNNGLPTRCRSYIPKDGP